MAWYTWVMDDHGLLPLELENDYGYVLKSTPCEADEDAAQSFDIFSKKIR